MIFGEIIGVYSKAWYEIYKYSCEQNAMFFLMLRYNVIISETAWIIGWPVS
jgi:hypothetical protein